MFEFLWVSNLGFVLLQRPHLDFPGIGYIQDDGWIAGQRDPDFAWSMRLKAFIFYKFWKEERIICGREDRIQHHLTGITMVGMVDVVIASEEMGWVTGDEDIGSYLADGRTTSRRSSMLGTR